MVTQDYGEAMRWYQKAADQGNADAQSNLGLMYRRRSGGNTEIMKKRWNGFKKLPTKGMPITQVQSWLALCMPMAMGSAN